MLLLYTLHFAAHACISTESARGKEGEGKRACSRSGCCKHATMTWASADHAKTRYPSGARWCVKCPSPNYSSGALSFRLGGVLCVCVCVCVCHLSDCTCTCTCIWTRTRTQKHALTRTRTHKYARTRTHA